MQAQQLIEERETQKQLAELPLIQMPIIPSPTISVKQKSFIILINYLLFSFYLVIGFIYCRSTKSSNNCISTSNAICTYSTVTNKS
jgi:hypothetical protein